MKNTEYGYISYTEECIDRDLEHWLSENRKQERLKKRKPDNDNGGNVQDE